VNELGEQLRELWASRRRLLPVLLGLCFGTLGLAVLLGFGNGFDRAMHSSLAQSGDALLRWSNGTTSRPFVGQPAGRNVVLTMADVELLGAAPGVVAASPHLSLETRAVAEGGVGRNAPVAAVGAAWATVKGRSVAAGGRFLSPVDEGERRRVVVLGGAVARELFGTAANEALVGRRLQLWDQPFTVVGVLPTIPAMMQFDGDDANKVYVPFATAAAILGLRTVGRVLTRVADPGAAGRAEAEQRALLASRHRFDRTDRAAVRINNQARNAAEIRGIVTGTRVFLLIVGVLGLLVAAVGVANMTLVRVEERVPEIGLRLALGAEPRQIRRAQLLETGLLVAIGGGLGLVLALAVLAIVDALPLDAQAKGYLGSPLLSLPAAAAIVLLLGVAAAIAGWLPAARAAAVQPVEALRQA
jgi:putative ABC transport system permease protein